MSYIEDKLKEWDNFSDDDLRQSEYLKDFLRTSLEEYRKELMSCIPEEFEVPVDIFQQYAQREKMGFNACCQKILNNIKQKGSKLYFKIYICG